MLRKTVSSASPLYPSGRCCIFTAQPVKSLLVASRGGRMFGPSELFLKVLSILSITFVIMAQAQDDLEPSHLKTIAIETDSGKAVLFTQLGEPKAEFINGRLNVVWRSQEGMLFELIGIPVTGTIPTAQIPSDDFRAILLHTPFQKAAATNDSFKASSILILRREEPISSRRFAIRFSGKLRAGTETLHVIVRSAASIPESHLFLTPQKITVDEKLKNH